MDHRPSSTRPESPWPLCTSQGMKTGERRSSHEIRFDTTESDRGRSTLLRDFTRQRHRPASGYQGRALLRRCALLFEDAHRFRKCASWKTPTISSKMRTLFQDAQLSVRTFASRSCGGLRTVGVGTQAAKKSPIVGRIPPGRKPKPGFDAGSLFRHGDCGNCFGLKQTAKLRDRLGPVYLMQT